MKTEIGSGIILFTTCILVILKLIGIADISWWLVFCPLWFPFILIISISILVALIFTIVVMIRIIINCI